MTFSLETQTLHNLSLTYDQWGRLVPYYGAIPERPWCPVCGEVAYAFRKLGPGQVRYEHVGGDFCVGKVAPGETAP